jgi:hypothetical protein
MKKPSSEAMRPEYDFSGGIRGKYAERYARSINVVLIDPELAAAFPASKSVNEALRALFAAEAERSKSGCVDEMRQEYDLSKLAGGVRGKYFRRAMAGSNVVLIDPDLATLFPDGESVNRALRVLAEAARTATTPKRRRTRAI